LNYRDASVFSSTRYFYVLTAVDSDGTESTYSNEASAEIPNN
jgi:fibronectin type 3 domain-containing protein